MKIIDFLTAQAQLAKIMRCACESESAITINGLGKDEVVVMSKAEYQRLMNASSFKPLLSAQRSMPSHGK